MSEFSLKDFEAAEPAEQLLMLRSVLNECADRCTGNMLTGGTWIEDSFRGAADRTMDIYSKLYDPDEG